MLGRRRNARESDAFARADAPPGVLRRALAKLTAGSRARPAAALADMAAGDEARAAHSAFYDYGEIGRRYVGHAAEPQGLPARRIHSFRGAYEPPARLPARRVHSFRGVVGPEGCIL